MPGRDIITTIDLPTQLVAEQGLIGRRGSVVAIDPNNGDVIAMVSTPGFDPNPFGRGLTQRRIRGAARQHRRAAAESRHPRRVSAGLDREAGDRARRSDTRHHHAAAHAVLPRRFYLPGSSHRFRDWRPSGHGVVAMETAIAQSCDVYFYELATMIGVDKLSGWLAHFGWDGRPASTSAASARASCRTRRGRRQGSRTRPTRCGSPARP